jgi:hypothetical protein
MNSKERAAFELRYATRTKPFLRWVASAPAKRASMPLRLPYEGRCLG